MLPAIVRILRPRQWLKNAIAFAPVVFARKAFDIESDLLALAAFAAFCALSSAVYVFNDILDVERDRAHPLKRHRPLPSGQLSTGAAWLLAVACAAVGLSVSAALNLETLVVSAAYVVLAGAYSLLLKNVVVLDVMALAMGFVLRAVAGATAIHAEVSPWLVVCTLLLAMFLALGKRRHELVLLADDASDHRPSLGEYTPYLLDQMIAIIAASTIMAYSLYTMSKRVKAALAPEPGSCFGPIDRQYLMGTTIPFVLYGLFRYLYLIHRRDMGGEPEKVLFLDAPLLACVLLWVLTAGLVLM